MSVELVPVAEQDKSVLANLMQLYRYDLSEIRGYDLTVHGTFTYRYLDQYFLEDAREACLITADGRLAGFTMTRGLDDGGREVSEFFVVRRHRRLGIGRTAAERMLRQHPGSWQLAVDHANHQAARFWLRLTNVISEGPVTRTEKYPPEVAFPGSWLSLRIGPAVT